MATFFTRRRRHLNGSRSRSKSIRIKVPLRLRAMLGGRAEVWRSLSTKDGHLAKLRAKVVEGHVSRLFLHLDEHGERMTKDQIESLVGSWLNTTLEEWEELRASGPELDDDQRDGQKDILGDQLEDTWTDLAFNRLSGIESVADGLLAEQGGPLPAGALKADKDSTTYRRLCRELLKAKMRMLKTEMERMDGEYKEHSTGRHNGAMPYVAPSPAPAVMTKLFSVVAEAYLKESANRQPRTQGMIRAGFTKFLKATGGDRSIGNISKDECRAYKESMTAEGLTPATINKHLYCLSHCLKWAAGQGYVPKDWKTDNPVTGLTIAKRIVRAQKERIVPFDDDELVTIFLSKEFTGWKTKRPERYYGLLALLLTAARREEVFQLDVADVVQEPASGIWYFNFLDSDEDTDKTLKNVSSRRRCPLPDFLVDLGFLDYVKSIRRHKRVFPQLTHGAIGYGDSPGKAWGRLMKRLKVGGKGKGKVLHSLRHGGCTKLAELGVPDAHAYALTGHVQGGSGGGDVHQDYVHVANFALKVLKVSIDKLGEAYREVLVGLLSS